MNNSKKRKTYIIFVIVFYIVIFKDIFDDVFPMLKMLDEAFALISIPLAIQTMHYNRGKIYCKKRSVTVYMICFLLIGLVGSYIYAYQPIRIVLIDMFLNLKFWLSIYVSSKIFEDLDFFMYGKKIARHIKFVTLMYVILMLLDKFFNFFPGDIRYGFKSTQLFYGIHTVFAATCVFLIGLMVIVKRQTNYANEYLVLLLLLLISTMRSKAFGAVILFVLLYIYIYILNYELKIRHIIWLGISCMIIGWSQIRYYFFSSISEKAARNVLLINCFKVANNHFPFGSGFGTYASFYSGIYYSPLYSMYGISDIYGLTKEHPSFVSDSFWPMVIAQNGYIGLAFFVMALYVLCKSIQACSKLNKEIYMTGFFVFFYLCISSLAESAFVHSIAVPLAIILGIIFSQKKNYLIEETRGKIDKKTITSISKRI